MEIIEELHPSRCVLRRRRRRRVDHDRGLTSLKLVNRPDPYPHDVGSLQGIVDLLALDVVGGHDEDARVAT
jgi:hypothetical protein